MKKNKFSFLGLVTGLLLSANAQAALINLSFTGTTDAGVAMEALFLVDSSNLNSGPFGGSESFLLTSTQINIADGTSHTYNDNGTYGPDSDLFMFFFSAENYALSNYMRLDFIPFSSLGFNSSTSEATLYTFDSSGNSATFAGSDFTVDLLTLAPNGLSGLFDNSNIRTNFTVDTLNINVTSISAVPVPAAIWLFGSGLIGLAGVARSRKK